MKNIFVGNLSFKASEQDVRALFEAHGTVDRVNIVTDRDTGQPRGFAFVEMSNDAEGDVYVEAELALIVSDEALAGGGIVTFNPPLAAPDANPRPSAPEPDPGPVVGEVAAFAFLSAAW